MESSVEKRQGRTFGPPSGKKMVLFVDDFSMPDINKWGDQITLEIVRQLIEFSGVYNLAKPGEWKSIVDLDFIGCMLTPGGGKNDISCMPGMNGGRCKRHFHIMNVTLPSAASIHQIFGSMVKAHFDPDSGITSPDVWSAAEKLVEMTIDVWEAVKAKMLPTPAKFHYVFNLRDISRIWQGMLVVAAPECQDVATILSLWRHECTRVLADRFTEHKDVKWFQQRIESKPDGTLEAFVVRWGLYCHRCA